MGDSCDEINVILATYLDEALDGDDKCFDVVAQLDGVSEWDDCFCLYSLVFV